MYIFQPGSLLSKGYDHILWVTWLVLGSALPWHERVGVRLAYKFITPSLQMTWFSPQAFHQIELEKPSHCMACCGAVLKGII